MSVVMAILRRELRGYFVTPLAWVFSVIFLLLAGALTFYVGDFYQRGQADLQPFFRFHPWLYLLLAPGLSMQMWSEERKRGTLELLLTLPVRPAQAMLGKFLAAWLFTAMLLVLTMPLWWTVNYLGHPDNGVIAAGYLGSLLMAGAYLAVGCCVSTLTRSQVVAFVLTVAVCFVLVMLGQSAVQEALGNWLPGVWVHTLDALGFRTHFADIMRGVLDMRDAVYFVVSIVMWLLAGVILLHLRRTA